MSQKVYDVIEFLINNEKDIKNLIKPQVIQLIYGMKRFNYKGYDSKPLLYKCINKEIKDYIAHIKGLNPEEADIIFDLETLCSIMPYEEKFLDEANYIIPTRS